MATKRVLEERLRKRAAKIKGLEARAADLEKDVSRFRADAIEALQAKEFAELTVSTQAEEIEKLKAAESGMIQAHQRLWQDHEGLQAFMSYQRRKLQRSFYWTVGIATVASIATSCFFALT